MERAALMDESRVKLGEQVQKRAALWKKIDKAQKMAKRALGDTDMDKRNRILNQINDLSSEIDKLLKRVQ